MYTMCWVDTNGNDRWDRFSSRKALVDAIIDLQLEEDEDVLIFSPDAEDARLNISALLNEPDPLKKGLAYAEKCKLCGDYQTPGICNRCTVMGGTEDLYAPMSENEEAPA